MRQASIILSAGLLMTLVGCGDPISMATTAGSTAFKAVRGAQADATPIRVQNPSLFASYRTLQVGDLTTDVPPICTPEIISKVRAGLAEAMRADEVRKAFPGGGDRLRLDIVCRFYKGKGMIGGEGRLDWLVTLTDPGNSQVLGVIFIEGISSSPLQHGAADMAKENARELIKYLRKLKARR